jgi:hypothetical protein
MPTELDPRGAICGVFHFLDTTLPESEIGILDTDDIGVGIESKNRNQTRSRIAERIGNTFRLMHWGSPLRLELDAFRLYHKGDMADAITAAYGLRRRGLDPCAALNADYAINWGGLLSWESEADLLTQAKAGTSSVFWQFQRLHVDKPGDRYVHYSLPTVAGVMLVRGDRLVWEVETLHMTVSGVDRSWNAAHAHFKSLGGPRGFLAGKFDWPPVGWVNPVNDEKAAV